MVANYTPKLKTSQVKNLPATPGIYFFRKGRKVLYIGKAANLRQRVRQHRALLNLVKQPHYIETNSEIKALILEAELIKKHKPKYNVLWRDDKNYFYVAITKEKLPRVFITHQIKPQTANRKLQTNYIGPFVDGKALRQTLKYLRKVFPYYTAGKHPKKACPWCHLKQCPGPQPEQQEYQKNINNLVKILRGKKKTVFGNLGREMTQASNLQNFERAAKIRDQMRSLEKVFYHAKIFEKDQNSSKRIKFKRIEGYDIANIQGKFAAAAMVVFLGDRPDKKGYRKFKIRWTKKPNDVAMLKEVLIRRLQHREWPLPDLILVDGGKAQLNTARDAISKLQIPNSKLRISIFALAKNTKHKGVKIYVSGKKKPISLSEIQPALRNLLLRINSEAHRFALSYHRKLHGAWLKQGN